MKSSEGNKNLKELTKELDYTKQRLRLIEAELNDLKDSKGFKNFDDNKTKDLVFIDNEDFLNRTGEIAKVGGWYLNLKTNQLYWTQGTFDIHDLPYHEMPSLEDAINFYHPEYRGLVRKSVNHLIKFRESVEFQAKIVTAKRKVKWVYSIGRPEIEDGELVAISGVFQDITERISQELETNKLQNQFRQIVDSIPGVIYQFIFNKDGSFSMPFVHEKANDHLSFTAQQMTNPEFLFSRIHKDDYESTMQSILAVNYDGANWTHTFRAINNENEIIWIEGHSSGSEDDSGNIVHNGVFFNITEQKNAELALAESQKQYQNVADNIHGIVKKYQLNPDGSDKILYISKGVENLFEVSQAEALLDSTLIWDRIHKDDVKLIIPSLQKSATELSIWEFQYRIVFTNGRIKWVDVRGIPIRQKDGSVIWDTIGIDITKRKKAEEDLERINKNLERLVEERAQKAIRLSRELERYWLAAEHAKSGVWRYDVRGNSLEWDDIMYELYGVDKKSFSGAYEAWETSLHPDDIEPSVKALQLTIENQVDFDTSFRIIHQKTGQTRYIRAKAKVELDNEGNTIAVFGTNYDITKEMQLAEDRKDALETLKSAQSQLIQSEKMASLGVLTAGVAHELNNPLNYISGGINAIREELKAETNFSKDNLLEYLEWIDAGFHRSAEIVKGLNLFSRENKEKVESCNIHEIIEDCLLMLRNKYFNKVDIIKEFTSEEVIVKGNNGKLHQAFLNLIANAIDAIPLKGKIEINTFIKSGEVYISFIDNGTGISKEDISKVMDPFYTTKSPGKGTGLGLYITYSIIKDHEGIFNITSDVGKGTKVEVALPL
ncbi:MAG: hypothetical protein Wins2KO_00330 [Winogradskyella sp.]